MQNILFLSAILYFFFSIFYIKKFKPPVRFKKILLLIMILNVIAFALFFWLNQHLYAAIGTVLLLTAALAVFNKVKLPPVPLKVRIYFKFLFAILLVFFFAIISIPENTKGRRYYDSARYFKQGFDISGKDRTGASPPIYPIFLNLVGENNAVVWQSIISVISWCVIGYAIGRMPGLITAGVFSVSPWFSHWNGLLLT